MKTSGQITYELEKKEDIGELMNQINFSFIPNMDGLTQVGSMKLIDIRPHLSLIEFVKDEFKNEKVKTLATAELEQFNKMVDELIELRQEFNKNDEILTKYQDEE